MQGVRDNRKCHWSTFFSVPYWLHCSAKTHIGIIHWIQHLIDWLVDWLTDWPTKCIHSLTEDILTVIVWHFTNQMSITCMHFICKTMVLNFQWVFPLVYRLKHLFSAIPRMHLPILLLCFWFCCLSCLLPLFWVL